MVRQLNKMTAKVNSFILLLLAVIILQTEAQLYNIESSGSLGGAPVGLYRRTSLGREEENIASLSGAKVGVYSKRERFQPQFIPVPYGSFFPISGLKRFRYLPPRVQPQPYSGVPPPPPPRVVTQSPLPKRPAAASKSGIGPRALGLGSLLGDVLGGLG
ncbi:uncharacterized protein LOC118182283 [Stegodyphus dumicola]|uniref:uncharacterized protein LOC118182283 n=1 Tax=Stegodyphus dumicola TaxID=202533 RepID=UPI0015A96EEA|nr:uncharacterized protein LOC118182283 [Stegodyphus dumicola]